MCNNAITVAAQNGVTIRDLGVGTSTLALVRSMGRTLGIAVATAPDRLVHRPTSVGAGPGALAQLRDSAGPVDLDTVKESAPGLYEAFVNLMGSATATAFTVALVAAGLAFVLALVMPRRELRTTSAAHPGSRGVAERASGGEASLGEGT